MIMSLLKQDGAIVIDGGLLGDDLQTVTFRLQNACEQSDMVITSGGVSMGKACGED